MATAELIAAAAAALVALEEEKRKLEEGRLELARGRAELLREREKLAAEKAAFARERAAARAAATGPTSTPGPASGGPAFQLERGRLIVPLRITYAWCCAFRTAPRATQGQVSHARRSQFLRVARLAPNVGRS